jgi:hypothetical protein
MQTGIPRQFSVITSRISNLKSLTRLKALKEAVSIKWFSQAAVNGLQQSRFGLIPIFQRLALQIINLTADISDDTLDNE